MAKATVNVDWNKVEEACRRSVRGRIVDGDQQLVTQAYQSDPATYAELSRRIRAEEQEAFRRSGGVA